jgi:hypothetical protein
VEVIILKSFWTVKGFERARAGGSHGIKRILVIVIPGKKIADKGSGLVARLEGQLIRSRVIFLSPSCPASEFFAEGKITVLYKDHC